MADLTQQNSRRHQQVLQEPYQPHPYPCDTQHLSSCQAFINRLVNNSDGVDSKGMRNNKRRIPQQSTSEGQGQLAHAYIRVITSTMQDGSAVCVSFRDVTGRIMKERIQKEITERTARTFCDITTLESDWLLLSRVCLLHLFGVSW